MDKVNKNIIKIIRVFIAIVLVFGMAFSPMAEVWADDSVIFGSITDSEGQTKNYTTEERGKLISDLESYEGDEFTVDIYIGFSIIEDKGYITIPQNKKVTLNLHDIKIDSSVKKLDYSEKGYLLDVGSGTTLTINGGNDGASFIGGRNWGDCGGIYIRENANVTLNKVTIQNCHSYYSSGKGGSGGGIVIEGGSTLTLNNSNIERCYAEYYGGAIYSGSEEKDVSIYLNNTEINNNTADKDGGAIYLAGDNATILGDGNTILSENTATTGSGGGVYFAGETSTLAKVVISQNLAPTGYGGGVYLCYGGTLNNLNIIKNTSAVYGGGVVVNNSGTSIADCVITENESALAGGVYVGQGVNQEFLIEGNTVINNNIGKNLYLKNDSRVNFVLTDNASITMGYESITEDYRIVTQGEPGDSIKSANCLRYLTSENDGYVFTFNSTPNNRKIYLEKEDNITQGNPDPNFGLVTYINATDTAPQVVGTVGDSDLIKGYFRYAAEDGTTWDSASLFYYSDGFFSDNTQYNERLSSASIAFALSTGGLSITGYGDKHMAGRQFLSDIGCDDETIYVNDDQISKPGTETVGVTIGQKTIGDTVLIPVGIRGTVLEAERAVSFNMGIADSTINNEHAGYAAAADKVLAEIKNYIEDNNLGAKVTSGKAKLWIVGYSEAGAVANLTCKRIIDDTILNKSKVYGYTFEAPMGGSKSLNNESYNCIHNVVNVYDMVTLLAPEKFGFGRYGVDHKVQYFDKLREDEIKAKINAFNNQLITVSHDLDYDDNFKVYSLDNSSDANNNRFTADEIFVEVNDSENEAALEATTMATFNTSFVQSVLEWSLTSRAAYSNSKFTLDTSAGKTVEEAVSNIFSTIYSTEEGGLAFRETADKIFEDGFSDDNKQTINSALSNKKWIDKTKAEKLEYVDMFYNALVKTGALEGYSASERSKIKANLPAFLDAVFKYADEDYENYNREDNPLKIKGCRMVMLATLVMNSRRIRMQHYPEVTLAWVRSEDSAFDAEKTSYYITSPDSVEAPTAWEDGQTEVLSTEKKNTIKGSGLIKLDSKNLKGETIHYTLEDITDDPTNPVVVKQNGVYYKGIQLEEGHYYRIKTYTSSNGEKSETVTYLIDKERIFEDYMPKIEGVEIEMAAPEGGEALADSLENIKFKYDGTKEFTVDPENLEITWNPAAGEKAAYETAYSVNVKIKKNTDGKYKIITGTGDAQRVTPTTLELDFGDSATAKINDTQAVLDKSAPQISYQFAATALDPTPSASVESGDYINDIILTLSTRLEGADIYYTLTGNDPSPGKPLTNKYAGAFSIPKSTAMTFDDDTIVMKAATYKDGKLVGEVLTRSYHFLDNIELPTFESLTYNGTPQIGIPAYKFYTVKAIAGSDVTIDKDGNVLAQDAGTYSVLAHIVNGLDWKITDDFGEATYTNEDQILSFTINRASLENAEVTVRDQEFTGEEIRPEPVVKLDDKVLVKDVDYEVSYYNNTDLGTASIQVWGLGNYTSYAEKTFEIKDKVEPDPYNPDPTPAPGPGTDPVIPGGETPGGVTPVTPGSDPANPSGGTNPSATTPGAGNPTINPPDITVVVGGKTISLSAAANAEDTKDALISKKSDADDPNSQFMPLGLKAAKCSKDSIKLAWNKVKGADGYMVFGSKCGGANKLELLGKATKTSFTSSDLSQKTAYKFVVVAYKGYNGNDKTLAISKTIHAFTEGGKVANYKKVKVNKTKATLKKGKTFKIKAKLVKPSKKKVKKHLGIRYESDNTAVATVASNGKVKAVGKGSCYVYAYAQNGICSKVKITVK